MNNRKISLIRVILFSITFLVLINFSWIWISKVPIHKLSLYNKVFAGRERFPFGEDPNISYNLSLFDLDAMFASHIVSADHENDSFKIFLVGDSSVWGFLQRPEETLSGLLNHELMANGRNIQVYNLGYPSISLLKDLMIIDKSLKFEPDLVIWLTTLEAFPNINQVETPILQGNPAFINQLIEKYDLNKFEKREVRNSDLTIINQRRNIADRINLQRLGFLWDATGKDQHYPEKYNKAQRDFEEPKLTYYGAENTTELEKTLAFEIIKQAVVKNPGINFVLVNEPILTSSGINSHLQYNYYYPRWAYDYFREKLSVFTNENEIAYYDFWKLIEEDGFTNSAIHLDAHNEQIFAIEILKIINKTIEK